MDSDDDLDGFLAGLRQRYNLGDEPTPGPSMRLAVSTDANIYGQDTPVFGNYASSISVAPVEKQSADQRGADFEGASVQPAATSAEQDAAEAAQPIQQDVDSTADLRGSAAMPVHAMGRSQLQQQTANDPPAVVSPAVSESASCATPLPQQATTWPPTTADAAAAIDMNTKAAVSETPSGILTIDGEGIAAAATPHTTAAMPAARVALQEQPATSVADDPAAAEAAAPESAVVLRPAAAGPAESVEAQAAMNASGSDDSGSPSSVKKPLYGAFLAAAAGAEGEPVAAGPAEAADGSTAVHPSQHGAGRPRSRSNVLFTESAIAEQEGHVEQQQRANVQQPQQLPSPSSIWKRNSNTPTRGVLKHDTGVLQEQHGLGQQHGDQQPQQQEKPSPTAQAIAADVHLYREITLTQSDLQQQQQPEQQQQQQRHSSPLEFSSTHTQQQQGQQQQRFVPSAALTALLAGTSTAAAMSGITLHSSALGTSGENNTSSSRPAAGPGETGLLAAWPKWALDSTAAAPARSTEAVAEIAGAADETGSQPAATAKDPPVAGEGTADVRGPPPAGQRQPADSAQQTSAAGPATPATPPAAAAADWMQLSSQLSMAGFGPLSLKLQAPGVAAASSQLLPELNALHETLSKVLREYQRRDSLMSQLLSERDDLRRDSGRSFTEHSRLERQRDEALRAAEKLKAELADIKQREIPALEAKHKDALSKVNSEAAKLKHALKEAEQAAAAAQAAAAGGELATLQQQLQDAVKEKERSSIECERLSSELSRQKPYIRDLERAAAAARAAARQSDDTAGLLERQLRELRQQQQDEVAMLGGELNKARHAIREAEQQLAALRAEAASGSDAAQVLLKQLTTERSQHEEQQAYLSSELQKLRQQILQLQSTATRAETAAKADSSAAAYSSKQLMTQEKQHGTEVARLQAELKQAREQGQLMQAKLTAAEAAAAEQLSAATAAAAAALQESETAAALQQELEKQRSSSKQQLQHLGQQLLEARKSLADNEQQLASTQAELRRLRAAAALVDATVPGAAAAAAGEDETAAEAKGFSVTPAGSARVAVPRTASDAAAAKNEGDTSADQAELGQDNESMFDDVAAPPNTAAAAPAAVSNVDLTAALGRAVRAEAGLADAEQQFTALRYKALQLETACNRKEKEIEALRDRLADKVVKEERRLARDKQAYARIRQAHAQSKRPTATTPAGLGLAALAGSDVTARRAAAGAVAAAARELRPVELVGIYESQKEVMEKELAAAKAEVRVLSGQLRDAQNLLISKDRAAAVAAAAAGLKGSAFTGLGDPAAAVAAQRKAAELQRELCSVRADAAAALREAAKRLGESEAVVKHLKEDNEGLQAELQARPTLNEYKQQKREIDLLQRKISTLRRQAATAAAGGAAVAGEDRLELAAAAVAAGEAWPPGEGGTGSRALGVRSVRAAIERDKAIARLGLGVVEEYPRDVLVDLLQLRDATMLMPNLRKMAAVVAAIPKLEAFVAQVCECCFRQGIMFVPAVAQQQMNPGSVPQVLQHWLQLLQQGEQLRLLTQQLQHLLAQRSSSSLISTASGSNGTLTLADTPITSTGETMNLQQLQQLRQQALQQVEQLLHVESAAVAASDVLSAAEGLMVEQPEGLLQQLLAQVQHLFDIPSLQGIPAAMNKVYVHYSELLNFFKALSSLLALPADAGPAAAMAAVSNIIQQAARPPSKVRAAAAELQKAAGLAEPAPEQPEYTAAGSQAEQQRDAAVAALQALLAAVGAGNVQGAVTKHQEMKQRLERLDQVLPRYQRLAAELYERLRVVSLDEVLPALDNVLAAATGGGGRQQ